MKLALTVLLLFFSSALSQNSWLKKYDIPDWWKLRCVCKTGSGYMLAGSTFSNISLMGVNRNGDIYWRKTIISGNPGSIKQTSDGGFIIAGNTNDYICDALLIRTNSQGDTIWTKRYGYDTYDEAKCVIETLDGGFVFAGYTRYFTGDNDEDFWIIKTDSQGNKEWEKYISNPGTDEVHTIFQLKDGSYIGSGLYSVYDPAESWWNFGSAIFKLNSSGEKSWLKSYYFSTQYTAIAKPLRDTGYFLGIQSSKNDNFNYWLILTDSNGDSTWSKIYDRTQIYDSDDELVDLIQTSDNGFALVGNSNTWMPNHTGYIGRYDVWLVKTDAAGDTLWTKNYGTEYHEYPVSVFQTDDDGFMIFCNTEELPYNFYMIKTDAHGNAQDYIHPLRPFSLTEPLDDTTFNTTFATFKWQQADTNLYIPIGLKYQLFLATNEEFNNPQIRTIEADSTITVSSLIPGTTYFWKVLAKNTAGDSLWSSGTRGFFVSQDATMIENMQNSIPQTFNMFSNYPNPFNPETTIKYALPADQSVYNVKIFIVDALGQLIKVLKDEPQNPGLHTLKWNGKNMDMQDMPSGVYFCVIKAGQFQAVQKMLLVR